MSRSGDRTSLNTGPFRFRRLRVRIAVLGRRLKRRDGPNIDLTNREFKLLAALLAAPERILTRDQLLEASRVLPIAAKGEASPSLRDSEAFQLQSIIAGLTSPGQRHARV